MLCKEAGYAFVWPKEGNPFLQKGTGPKTQCDIEQHAPVICTAHQSNLQFIVKSNESILPVVGDDSQVDTEATSVPTIEFSKGGLSEASSNRCLPYGSRGHK